MRPFSCVTPASASTSLTSRINGMTTHTETQHALGGGGVGQREQREDPLATQPDRKIELSQTNRGVGGVCVRVVPRVQSKLSRALHAHRGKKLLQNLQTQESTTMKRAMVRFQGAREKGAMAFVEFQGVSQEDTMEGWPPVEGNLRQEPEVA